MNYITVQDILDDHKEIVQIYGGREGVRDMGLLISALEMPKAAYYGEDLHPTLFDKAAAYLFHIVCNHPLIDSNKRTGTIAALTFLRQNGVHIKFTEEQSYAFEEIVVSTANSKVSKAEIAAFLRECYNG